MGVFKMSTGGSGSIGNGQPIVSDFTIARTQVIGEFCIAEVRYPNCLNYEGRKILVFEDCNREEILSLKTIDPHFTNDTNLIARFKPDTHGWSNAVRLCESMT